MKNLNLFKIFLFEKPYFLTIDGWDEWDKNTKLKYPIKWFLIETIPDKFNIFIWYPITNFIKNLYWYFRYRYNKNHQYHIIRPKTLKPGYHNQYDLIIHTNFHILTEFIEYEKSHGNINWQHDKIHSNFWKEANRLVEWWSNIRPYRESKLDTEFPIPDGPINSEPYWMLCNKYKNTDEYKKYDEILNQRNKRELEFENEDESNLISLMKIRMFLWN